MLEQFLPSISNPADYLTALSLFKVNLPPTHAEVEALLTVYAKYLPESVDDPEYCKVCLAVDLLPGRTREDLADFAPLELNHATLDALFTAKEIISTQEEFGLQKALGLVTMVQDENITLSVRVVLARLALDAMTNAVNSVELRDQIAALAGFLTGCGTHLLDRCSPFVREVYLKCKN